MKKEIEIYMKRKMEKDIDEEKGEGRNIEDM